MKKDKAAAIYARTLLETAVDQNVHEAVSKDMSALIKAFSELPNLHKFLTNPIRVREEKARLIQMAATQLSPLLRKFLKLLEIKNRFGLLRGIAEEFLILEEAKKNIMRAKVFSAIPLSSEQMNKLTRELETSRPGKTFILSNPIDATLIAGFRIEQGDIITDASIKHKLDLLKQKLAA